MSDDISALLTAIKESNATILTAFKESNERISVDLQRFSSASEKAIGQLVHAIERIPLIRDSLDKGESSQKGQWQTIFIMVAIMTAVMSPVLVMVNSSRESATEIKKDLSTHANLTGHVGLLEQAARADEQYKAAALRFERIDREVERLRDRWEIFLMANPRYKRDIENEYFKIRK